MAPVQRAKLGLQSLADTLFGYRPTTLVDHRKQAMIR